MVHCTGERVSPNVHEMKGALPLSRSRRRGGAQTDRSYAVTSRLRTTTHVAVSRAAIMSPSARIDSPTPGDPGVTVARDVPWTKTEAAMFPVKFSTYTS